MVSKKENQNSPPDAVDDGKIRVTTIKKKRFSLFKKQEPVEEDNVIYEPDSLKGRNPVESAKSKTAEKTPSMKRSPAASRRATWAPATPSTAGGSSPLAGRNPVDFDKCKDYVGAASASRGANNQKKKKRNSLAGRNPVDFDATDPYGNPIKSKTPTAGMGNGLEGRNPKDFDATDPYGNPIANTTSSTRSSVKDRNPVDFNATDPYGNPIPSNDKEDSFAGRNPVDFSATDPYIHPKTTTRSDLEDRNPKDFDATDPYGNKGNRNNSVSKRNSLAGRNPQDKKMGTGSDFIEVSTVFSVQSEGDSDLDNNFQQETWIPSNNTTEKEEEEQPIEQKKEQPVSRRQSSKLVKDDDNDDDNLKGNKVGSEGNTTPTKKQTKRRSTIKKPKSTREKFSLQTYHQPRAGVPAS